MALFIVEALRRLNLFDTLYRRRSTIADTVDRADVPSISNHFDIRLYTMRLHPTFSISLLLSLMESSSE
jgi:hypothetical protein